MIAIREGYRPYLIQRWEGGFNPNGVGIDGLLDADYMGSAEYEFGAIPKSVTLLRDACAAGEKFVIVYAGFTAQGGPHSGMGLHALMRESDFQQWDMQKFREMMAQIYADERKNGYCRRLKESASFDGNYCAWQDIKNHVWFSFSPVFLNLIHSVLSRPRDYAQAMEQHVRMGDMVRVAVIQNGRCLNNVRNFREISGKVCGIMDELFSFKAYGKKYTMPYVYVLTTQVEVRESEA